MVLKKTSALSSVLRCLSFAGVVLLLLPGCAARSFEMFAASDFVVLESNDRYDFRATTPEGLVLGAREFDNRNQHGELSFWEKAIENELRFSHGYALLEKKRVTTLQGISGSQLQMGLDRGQQAHLYIVTIFVTADHVFVLEAGGTEELVKRHRAQLDWTVREFVIR